MVPRRPQDTDVVKEAGAWQRTKEGKPRVMAERGQGSEKALKGTEEEAKKRGQECRVADGSGSPKVKGGGRLGKREVPPIPSAIFYLPHRS